MPWSYPNNVPRPAKNWDADEQKKCTAAANAVLREQNWAEASDEEKEEIEQQAIFACIRAAGKTKKDFEVVHEVQAEDVLQLMRLNPDLTDSEVIEAVLTSDDKLTDEVPALSKFYALKDAQGKDVWVALSGGSFIDREKEIVSCKAIDFGIAYGDETGQRGELRLYHYPNSRVGACTFQMRRGNFLVEAGTWDDTPRAQKAKEWVERNNPEDVGVSVGFFYNPKKFKDRVYQDEIIFFERSILKRKHASYPWSNIKSITRRLKAMSHEKDLTDMIGEDMTKAVLEGADEATKLLEEQGVAFKQQVTEEAQKAVSASDLEGMSKEDLQALRAKINELLKEEPEEEEKGEAKKEAQDEVEFQLNNAAVKAIAEAVAELIPTPTDISGLETEVKALKTSVTSIKTEIADEVGAQVAKTFENLPKATLYRATKEDAADEEVQPKARTEYVHPLDRSFEDGINVIEQSRGAGR